MDCPVCKTERLMMMERQGIEIDYCSKCRGVWLDRGELDKIVERSTVELAAAAPALAAPRRSLLRRQKGTGMANAPGMTTATPVGTGASRSCRISSIERLA